MLAAHGSEFLHHWPDLLLLGDHVEPAFGRRALLRAVPAPGTPHGAWS